MTSQKQVATSVIGNIKGAVTEITKLDVSSILPKVIIKIITTTIQISPTAKWSSCQK